MKTCCLLIVLLFCAGCGEKTNTTQQDYFSVPAFIQSEIIKLKENKIQLIKTIRQNGKTETRPIATPDWENELKPFLTCDINQPVWKNAYRADTLFQDTTVVVHYTPKDPKAPVKKLSVYLTNEKVHRLHISFEKSNTWFSTRQELNYYPGQHYTIFGGQQMTLSAASDYAITAQFINTP